MQKILFVIDKLELKYFEFNKLVTNFWLIKEFLEQKNDVYVTTLPNLMLRQNVAYTICYETKVENENIFYNKNIKTIKINDFDLVMFRPDPPVDIDYINATYIFDFVTKPCVINSPASIRDFNEKLHAVKFCEFMPDNIVTSSMSEIRTFLEKHNEIVLKPLNQCFGSGVMYLHKGDPNMRTIINTMTHNETTLVMVQKFISAVRNGDKRVLTLGDSVSDYCVKKLPTSDDFKFNTHSDDFIVKAELSTEEKMNFSYVAKKLNSMGIFMAGMDVVDGKIIEINVTSPCYFIKEINNLYNVHFEKDICDYIFNRECILA